MTIFLKEDNGTTWNESYTYYGHTSWWEQRNYLEWRRTVKLAEMTAIPFMAIFLEENSETIWNNSYANNGHIPWGGQGNYLKWQIYLLWPCFLRKTTRLPEMTAIPIMAIFFDEDSDTTWNDSYTYYGYASWGGQQNHLIWQQYLLWPCFSRKTTKLPEMIAG